jgi:ribose transport system substrate-binding protein
MDCGSASCTAFGSELKAAGARVGVDVSDVTIGTTASSIASAYNSVAQQKPDGVIIAGTLPQLYQPALASFKKNKVAVVSTGVLNAMSKWGFSGEIGSGPYETNVGKTLADYVYTQHQDKANVVIFYPPEFSYAPVQTGAFRAELNSLCSGKCPMAEEPIAAATFGNTAPATITSYLHAHPQVNTAYMASSSMLSGVPTALSEAGVKVDIYTTPGSDPTSLQYIKAGQVTAAFSEDLNVAILQALDQDLRIIMHEPVTPALLAEGQDPPQMFLTKANVTFNPAAGWTSYPDAVQRFVAAWEGK